MELTVGLSIAVVLLAGLCLYLSVSIGVGYGTILTPLLLIIGFTPLQVIPAVLVSQVLGATVGGLAHHRVGNIKLDFRQDSELVKKRLRGLGYLPRSNDAKVVLVLVTCGIAGVLLGAFTALKISTLVLETYIGVMVLGVGLAVLFKRSRKNAMSWSTLAILGIVGAFNKGMSSGGYVPLVTGGQIINGREAKSSVGSTSIAVGIICAVGFLSYVLAAGGNIYWWMAATTSIGAVVAAPMGAFSVKRISGDKIRFIIGVATTVLGALTLVRAFLL
jgi:uncharacterized membrane protein YfcA